MVVHCATDSGVGWQIELLIVAFEQTTWPVCQGADPSLLQLTAMGQTSGSWYVHGPCLLPLTL